MSPKGESDRWCIRKSYNGVIINNASITSFSNHRALTSILYLLHYILKEHYICALLTLETSYLVAWLPHVYL